VRNSWKWIAAAVACVLIFRDPAGSAHFVDEAGHAIAVFIAGI
jgi:hypothetical protein